MAPSFHHAGYFPLRRFCKYIDTIWFLHDLPVQWWWLLATWVFPAVSIQRNLFNTREDGEFIWILGRCMPAVISTVMLVNCCFLETVTKKWIFWRKYTLFYSPECLHMVLKWSFIGLLYIISLQYTVGYVVQWVLHNYGIRALRLDVTKWKRKKRVMRKKISCIA